MRSPKSPKQTKVNKLHQRAIKGETLMKYRHNISQTTIKERTVAEIDINLMDLKRRSSSFASPSSPWARRRSFLSNTMISSEKHRVYQLHSGFSSNSPSFSISLRESQGFTWNQDLFASQYTQRSGLLYDDEDDNDREETEADKFQDVFYDDEEDDEDEGKNGLYSRRARNYSMSNDYGINKVKVIEIKVDENDAAF